jgi:transcriptional regulator with XRE-family HTH domain
MLTELLQDKNINLTKLSELTGVSERYLEALIEEKYEKLPASPYVRSYLFKIAEVLNADGQKLWDEYQKNSQLKKSGLNDRLPFNRYQPRPGNKKTILLIIIIILLLGYLIFRFRSFLGQPSLILFGPMANSANLVVSVPSIKIEGRIKIGDQLVINQEKIYVDEKGYFQKDFPLQPGLNIAQFQIKKFLGRETTITKQILYLNGENQ